MTLAELSISYTASAQLLKQRLRELRQLEKAAQDVQARQQLRYRIRRLTVMQLQMNELAALTQHYYDRGYWRNAKYVL